MKRLFTCCVAATALALLGCGETPTEVSEGPDYSLSGNYLKAGTNRGKIVFATERDGNSEIYIMNPDGSGLKNLTNHPDHDTEPSWSRNGEWIVFGSNRRNPDAPFLMQDIWIMRPDGSHLRRVTTTDAQDQFPHMSPNGKQILFTRGQQPPPFPGAVPQNFVINVDGTGETNLTNNAVPGCFPFGPLPCVFEAYPRWSPDGRKILFNRADNPGFADIWVMNADGSGKTNLTNSPDRNDFFGNWSPNGKQIAFTSATPFSPDGDIYVMNANGSGLRNVTNTGAAAFDVASVWSPNGKWIAFHSFREENGSFDIFTINREGKNEVQLTNEPGLDGWPSWVSRR